ncbi:MAG TPA: hypothetical protein P5256_01585 [Beijerinckiaceae bacterium]|nr:hypothetical protein [Rhodoblastus sp.]MCC2106170.1 hypothetical protein [Hyphomicrobiales bacterium]HPG02449.1 hypothetical protein [Rhodoblastus sp.]HRY01788.1 hypothetical protein [Beijerinckiaceae bacterium]
MPTTTRRFYRLRDSRGRIVMLSETPNRGDDCCNATTVELSMHGDREAHFGTIEAVQRVLSIDTPWYNSSEDRPSWGSLDTKTMTAERVTEVIETTVEPQSAADIRLPVWGSGFYLADIQPDKLRFFGEPVAIQMTHRLAVCKQPTDTDPETLVGRDFFLRDRRAHGVAIVTYAGYPALLIDVGN